MTKPVVLVVEDNAAIRRGLFDALRLGGYEARECARGDEAAILAMQTPLDLVLLDVMLPAVDGFTLLADLRQARPRLGIIMLTARGAEDDRVRGLRLGADDYVVKPFSVREVLARVEAVLRRASERPLDVTSLQLGDRSVDLARREILLPDGETRRLSEREAEILRYLAIHRGRAVHRQELLQKVWGYRPTSTRTRTVDVHIGRLREKLEADPARPRIVVTVRSRGYMIGHEVAAIADETDPP
jgi:DNA-binding response OmpR family regulator